MSPNEESKLPAVSLFVLGTVSPHFRQVCLPFGLRFCAVTQGKELPLFQPPENWRAPGRLPRGSASQRSLFRSAKTAPQENLLFHTRTNPSAECLLSHFRTSGAYSYLTISSAGTELSRVVGTPESSSSTRTPACTGEGRLPGKPGALSFRPPAFSSIS